MRNINQIPLIRYGTRDVEFNARWGLFRCPTRLDGDRAFPCFHAVRPSCDYAHIHSGRTTLLRDEEETEHGGFSCAHHLSRRPMPRAA